MRTGMSVRFAPAGIESDELRSALEALEDSTGVVCVATLSGECAVILPDGVTIPGYSLPLLDGWGRHYVNVHWSYLEEVVLLAG
jgi:hypothetical protein